MYDPSPALTAVAVEDGMPYALSSYVALDHKLTLLYIYLRPVAKGGGIFQDKLAVNEAY